jgi:hypothetical protein
MELGGDARPIFKSAAFAGERDAATTRVVATPIALINLMRKILPCCPCAAPAAPG